MGSQGPYGQHVAALDLLLLHGLQLDYNRLCCGSEACAALVSVETVDRLDQVVAAIPAACPGRLTAARLHLMLAEKVFFQHGATTDNWIEAFRCFS